MQGLFNTDKYRKNTLNIDIGVRLLLLCLTSIATLYLSDTRALILVCVFSCIYALFSVRVGLVLKVYLALVVLTVVAVICIYILFIIFPSMASASRGMNVAAPFLRIFISANMLLATAMNISLTKLSATLGRMHLPGFLKLPLMIVIRFIPTFFNDVTQLSDAIKLRFRGRTGIKFWLSHPVLWTRVFFMPVVIRLIRSSDELAVAAELKGLSASTKFSEGSYSFRRSECLSIATCFAVLVAAVVIQKVV